MRSRADVDVRTRASVGVGFVRAVAHHALQRDGRASITTANPQRLLDTRPGMGALDPAKGRLVPFVPVVLPASALAGAGSSPAALLLNVTVVAPAADGYLTVYPCQAGPPLASNANYRTGEVRPNLVEARPDSAGHICVVSMVATDLVVDVDGWAG
jgi:hypothetical protein